MSRKHDERPFGRRHDEPQAAVLGRAASTRARVTEEQRELCDAYFAAGLGGKPHHIVRRAFDAIADTTLGNSADELIAFRVLELRDEIDVLRAAAASSDAEWARAEADMNNLHFRRGGNNRPTEPAEPSAPTKARDRTDAVHGSAGNQPAQGD